MNDVFVIVGPDVSSLSTVVPEVPHLWIMHNDVKFSEGLT